MDSELNVTFDKITLLKQDLQTQRNRASKHCGRIWSAICTTVAMVAASVKLFQDYVTLSDKQAAEWLRTVTPDSLTGCVTTSNETPDFTRIKNTILTNTGLGNHNHETGLEEYLEVEPLYSFSQNIFSFHTLYESSSNYAGFKAMATYLFSTKYELNVVEETPQELTVCHSRTINLAHIGFALTVLTALGAAFYATKKIIDYNRTMRAVALTQGSLSDVTQTQQAHLDKIEALKKSLNELDDETFHAALSCVLGLVSDRNACTIKNRSKLVECLVQFLMNCHDSRHHIGKFFPIEPQKRNTPTPYTQGAIRLTDLQRQWRDRMLAYAINKGWIQYPARWSFIVSVIEKDDNGLFREDLKELYQKNLALLKEIGISKFLNVE